MGKKTPAAPATPDYRGAAVEQGAANLEAARATARLSNPNTYTPYGTQLISYDGDIPTIRQTLTPTAQKTLEAQQGVELSLANLGAKGANTASGVLDKPFSFGGPEVQTSLDLSGIAKMPVNAGMTGQEAIMSRLNPSLARQRTTTETNLINQGLRPGSEAYDNAIRSLGEQETDARTQAVLQGLNLDIGANQQGFGQQLEAGKFGNTAQQQALAEAIQLRQLPLNEITALMSGSQIQNPQFGAYSGATVNAAPVFAGAQAQGQFDMSKYEQDVSQANAATAGMYSLGGAALKASDRRLKSNIVRIGTHPIGIGIYEYDIFGSRQIGVMAQELMEVMPEAVHQHPAGFLMVDYGRL
jgi:hypothetical protein